MFGEKKENNNNVLYIVVIVLLVIIAILAFFLWKKMWTKEVSQVDNNWIENNIEASWSQQKQLTDLTITLIDDKRCEDCNLAYLESQLQTVPFLSHAEYVKKDFSDEWVKDYIKENGIEFLPAIIFSTKEIEDPDGAITKFLAPMDSWEYKLKVWSSFDPFAEICDNWIDDDGNSKVDCEDEGCLWSLLCREETKNTLDLFVMWYCPYWELAMKALSDLEEKFWEDYKLDIHYIANKTGTGYSEDDFQSLHWVTEVQEDIRQLCIKEKYWIKELVKYSAIRYGKADNYWRVSETPKESVEKAWLDFDKISSCTTSGEWAKLLEEDIKIAESLMIGASPTWLANNKYQFWWIYAADIQEKFCNYNEDLSWCETDIEATDTTGSAPQCN